MIKSLAELAIAGVGVHHAGLSLDDRRATEELYLNKILRVIVSTSVSPNRLSNSVSTVPFEDVSRWRQPP